MFKDYVIHILDRQLPVQTVDQFGNIINQLEVTWKWPMYSLNEIV